MKQSRGIKINAVITALKATQNQDNSRRLGSRKKDANPHYTSASAFFLKGRRAAACPACLESVQTFLPFILLCSKLQDIFFFLFFFWNPVMVAGSHSAEVGDASSHLFAVNRGCVKVST